MLDDINLQWNAVLSNKEVISVSVVRSVFHAVSLLPTATLLLMDICLLDNMDVAYLPITDHKPLL
jgi:hypothetical protein